MCCYLTSFKPCMGFYYSYNVRIVNNMLLFHLELKKFKDGATTLNWVVIKTAIL